MGLALTDKFFLRPTLEVAPELLGMELVSFVQGRETSGIIVEVEAYLGDIDEASHCFRGRTPRNEVMFWEGGHCYVYLIYGMHHCVNVVTEGMDCGAAVLIRALEPKTGIETMQRRRGTKNERLLTSGPGRLCQALSITDSLLGERYLDKKSRIRLRPSKKVLPGDVICSKRIGISKSKELPWRFTIKDSEWLSKPIKQ